MKVIHDISLTGRPVRCGGMAVEALFPADGKSLWVDVDATSAFQDTAGTVPAVYGQSVARIDDMGPNGLNALQSSATARPLLGRAPVSAAEGGVIDQGEGPAFLRLDLTDDSLSHSLASGLAGDLIVFGRSGSWIVRDLSVSPSGALSIGPSSASGAVQGMLHAVGDITGWVGLDRALSDAELAALISYFRLRGARGLLVTGPELLSNNDFTNGSADWTLGAGWSIANGLAIHVPASGSDLVQTGVLTPYTTYFVSLDIAQVRQASLVYVRLGSTIYTQVGDIMTAGTRSVILRTSADVSTGFVLRAGGPSDVDFNGVSLRELRAKEDW